MATENGILLVTKAAGVDLSDYQYCFVELTSSDTVIIADAATDPVLGILQNAPGLGEAAVVMVIGISKCYFGETVAVNEWVKIEAATGQGMDADVALDIAAGRCVKGGGDGELGEVLLSGASHQVNVAS